MEVIAAMALPTWIGFKHDGFAYHSGRHFSGICSPPVCPRGRLILRREWNQAGQPPLRPRRVESGEVRQLPYLRI